MLYAVYQQAEGRQVIGIEQCYDAISNIYGVLQILLEAYCLVVWIRPFMAERKQAWPVGGVYACSLLFFYLVPFYINVMLVYGIGMAAVLLVMRRLDMTCGAQKLFLTVTFFCVRWQAWRIVSCVSNEMLLLTGHLFSYLDEWFWFCVYAIRLTLDTAFGYLLMYGAVRCLLWSYGRRREHMNITEFLLLAMPSVSGVCFYGVFRYYNYVYERDSGKSPFDLYAGFDFIILLYSLVCFAIIFVMTYVFRQWKNEKEEDKRQEVFFRQMQDTKSHIAEVERLYRDMRSLRHDVGDHLMTLQQLCMEGAYEEAGRYAQSFQEQLQAFSSDLASGNPVTDVVLSGKKKEMEEKGICFECDFHYPQSGTVDAFDISMILNNAIANAIEASERAAGSAQPVHVSLSSCCVKHMYVIEVTNSFAGELATDTSTGLPVSQKSGDGHGFGLANIRRAAQSYYGDIEIGKEIVEGEERCVLRVMMQLS